MVLSCSYQWSAVRTYHYKVLRSIEMGLVKWGDWFKPFKQPFFIPTALLPPPDTISKSKKPQPKLTSPSPSILCHDICDAWSWHDDCTNSACPKQHVYVACKCSDHQAFCCPKRRYPVPTRHPHPSSRDCLHDPSPPSQPFPFLDWSSTQPRSPQSSPMAHSFPIKSHLTSMLVSVHSKLQSASGPNAFTLRLPVPSSLNIPEWHTQLRKYHDQDLCDFLEFGWPVGYSAPTRLVSTQQNHGSATSNPQVIDVFLATRCLLGATCGPFTVNPLAIDLVTSPLQVAYSRSGKPPVVVDLSFPHGTSVNSGIPNDTYLGEPFTLGLPGVDALIIIRIRRVQVAISSRWT